MEPDLKVDLTKVVDAVYTDGVSDTIREVSKIGVDAVKTIRLALLPLQVTAALQDRVASYIDKAVRKVPEVNRQPPIPSIALPIIESLRYQEDGEILTEAFINLLSATFDSQRFGEAHPAFNKIIGQLSSDEAVLLNCLSRSELKIYFGREPQSWAQSSSGIVDHFSLDTGDGAIIDWRYVINPDELMQPKYLQVYIEHLTSLGVVGYTNEYGLEVNLALSSVASEKNKWAVKLTKFGALFHQACIGGIPDITATRHDDGI